jgi:hypothetical protein
MVLNQFYGDILREKYVLFYIVCVNLMVNVDQLQNLQRLTQKRTESLLKAMTYWYLCVTIVEEEE